MDGRTKSYLIGDRNLRQIFSFLFEKQEGVQPLLFKGVVVRVLLQLP
jgi:hypothetical protein